MDRGSLPHRWFMCNSLSRALADPDVVQLGEFLNELGAEVRSALLRRWEGDVGE